jgi:hypothetical protein
MERSDVFSPPPLSSHPPQPNTTATSPRYGSSAQDQTVRIVRPMPPRDTDGSVAPLTRPKSGARSGATSVGYVKARLSPVTALRPLRAVTERRSQEDNALGRRARRDQDGADKVEIVADGASAGREGRHFAVSNVGNNGRIYLRRVTAADQSCCPSQS